MILRKRLYLYGTLLLALGGSNFALAKMTLGPAPEGDPITVSAKVIHSNFDRGTCPKVVESIRMRDGGLRAVCSNAEVFRVFVVNSKTIAMRCSVANAIGVEGC